jgi:hypothetical protein
VLESLRDLIELLIGQPAVDENVSMHKGQGAKKLAFKLIGKKVHGYLQDGLAGCPSYLELKEQIRQDIPGLGMDDLASATLPTVTKAVTDGAYSEDTDTVAYLVAINSMEQDRSSLEQTNLKVDLVLAEINVVCTVVGAAFSIYALLQGVPTQALVASRNFTALKAATSGFTHVDRGIAIWKRGYEYQIAYEKATLGLVGASPP